MDNLNTVARDMDYPTYLLSVRNDFKLKNLPNNPSTNWKNAELDAVALSTHCSTGFPVSVSRYKGGYRDQKNALETWMFGLDFEKSGFTVEDAAEHPLLSQICGVIMPTASDTPDNPRARAFARLDRNVSGAEYKQLGRIFLALLPDKGLDPSVLHNAAFFFGSQPDPARVYVNPNAVLHVDPFLKEYADLVAANAPKARARAKRLEGEGASLHNSAKTNKRDVRRAKMLVKFVLDHYAGKMPNPVWYRFRLAAQAASGQSLEVFNEMIAHPYWQHDEWDAEAERRRWESEEPQTVTVGTLYAMAHELGWGTKNAAEVETDFTISGLSELPAFESYCLKAFTGIGKSQEQRATIAGVLEAGLKVCWIVPTKSLARAAATSFADLGASVYLDDTGEIKSTDALRAMRFVVTTPQTFTSRIAAHGLKGYGLLVLDEVQQIADAVFNPHSELWRDRELNAAFLAAIEHAKDTQGLVLRGLDAGIARGAQEWLKLPVYACSKTLEKAPVTLYTDQGALLATLYQAMQQEGALTYVTCDTKEASNWVAQSLRERYPEKRVLLINAETVDTRYSTCDARAIAFMNDPNAEVGGYDVVIVSPAMLTGVSITERTADFVFQHCSYLPPKSNLQMLNRFRRQGQVFVFYQGMGAVGDVKTPEDAAEQAEALLEHVAHVDRSEKAMRYEQLRYWAQVDALYQSFDPCAYYVHLLETEGRTVTRDADSKAAYRLASATEDNEAWEWALDHYPEVDEYDPLKHYQNVDEATMNAMLLKREVSRKTEGGWVQSDDKRRTALAAQQFRSYQLGLTETANGTCERSNLIEQMALDPDTPPSLIRADDKIVVLLHGLRILGYRGETSIAAQTFVERGQELVNFLSDNRRYWNAIFPKSKHLEPTGDCVSDARTLTKHLLSLLGLEMRRGRQVRINGRRERDAEIGNIGELKHVLYLRACGRALTAKTALPDGVEIIFPELADSAGSTADQDALDWLKEQPEHVWSEVRAEISRGRKFAPACADVKEWLEGDVF